MALWSANWLSLTNKINGHNMRI